MAIVRLDLDNTRNTVSEVFAAAQVADEDDEDDAFNIEQWAEAERNEDRRKSLGIDIKRLATIPQVTRIEGGLTRRFRALRKVVEKTAADFDDMKQSIQKNSNGIRDNHTAFVALAAELKEHRRTAADQQKELRQRGSHLEELAKNMADEQKELRQRGSHLEELAKNMVDQQKELRQRGYDLEELVKKRQSEMADQQKELRQRWSDLEELAKKRQSEMADQQKELLQRVSDLEGLVKKRPSDMPPASREAVGSETMQALKQENVTLKQENVSLKEEIVTLKQEIATAKRELEDLKGKDNHFKSLVAEHYFGGNIPKQVESRSEVAESSHSAQHDDQASPSIPRHDSQSRLLDDAFPGTGASQQSLKNRLSSSTLVAKGHKFVGKLSGSKTSLHH
jgi:DNA repair exonuclease SbcCD ATPase subunit